MRSLSQLQPKFKHLDWAVSIPDPALVPRNREEFYYLMQLQGTPEEDKENLFNLWIAGAFVLWREWDQTYASIDRIAVYTEMQQQWRITTQANANYHRHLAGQLRRGEISLDEFHQLMINSITEAATASMIAVYGPGWASSGILQSMYGGYLARELNWLSQFVAGLRDGSVLMDGNVLRRAAMYGYATYALFHALQNLWASEGGIYTMEENVLGVAEHCDGCLAETAKGKVPIGSLAPIGTRDCLSNCRCSIRYYP